MDSNLALNKFYTMTKCISGTTVAMVMLVQANSKGNKCAYSEFLSESDPVATFTELMEPDEKEGKEIVGVPSFHSDSKEERITARRRRVEARIEAARCAALGQEPQETEEEVPDPEKERRSRKQVDKSELRLEKLITDGTQLVTNVAVAGDSKEVLRRQEEEEAKRARYEKLEAEATAGAERFDEIMKKWLAGKGKKIPQEVHELLQQQKALCAAMVDEKEKLISEFQQELKGKDDQYVKYLKKQAEDVDLILERMEEQSKTVMKSYMVELGEIEKSFETERRELLEKHQSLWEERMSGRSGQEAGYLEEREKRVDENEAQLNHLRVRSAEEFNQIKITLETDIQILQQQIQQMKATFQLNAEKLEYNFQVLKKRDEENTVTISQQKRKLTRLQDTCNTVKAKAAKQEKAHHDDLMTLMEEYRKNTEQYRELQKKMKHFQLADARRFHDIWVMNEEKVRSLADEVLSADEIIHKQQLGCPWERPPPIESPMANILPMQVEPQLSQATLYASQVLSDAGSDQGPVSEPTTLYPPLLIREALSLLCEESGFLIESKLTRLLAPLEKDEQLLMKLDSIFKALGIETEEDVHKLVKYFVQEEASREAGEPTAAKYTLIHANEVSQALRRFVEYQQATGKQHSAKSSLLQTMATKEVLDGKFWEQVAGLLPESHERVWSALQEGLEKYHSTLAARSELIQATDSLRQQNIELRLLLNQYMHARINQELEIPPTLTLPVTVESSAS